MPSKPVHSAVLCQNAEVMGALEMSKIEIQMKRQIEVPLAAQRFECRNSNEDVKP